MNKPLATWKKYYENKCKKVLFSANLLSDLVPYPAEVVTIPGKEKKPNCSLVSLNKFMGIHTQCPDLELVQSIRLAGPPLRSGGRLRRRTSSSRESAS